MTSEENPITREPIETALRALEKRDAVAAARAFAADGRLVDPQFPDPEYRGREPIRRALEWALANVVDQPEFTIRHFLEHEGTCALEVETRLVGTDGSTVECRQAYVVELGVEGIAHWRTYLPFAPEGR